MHHHHHPVTPNPAPVQFLELSRTEYQNGQPAPLNFRWEFQGWFRDDVPGALNWQQKQEYQRGTCARLHYTHEVG